MSKFTKDLLATIGAIAKVVFWIVMRNNGAFDAGLGILILTCVLTLFLPMGGTIAFVAFKLMGKLTLGWPWILLMMAMDGFMSSIYLDFANE